MPFTKGQKPWNFGTEVITDRTCQFCEMHFPIPERDLKRDRGTYCSKTCFYRAKIKYGKRDQIVAL